MIGSCVTLFVGVGKLQSAAALGGNAAQDDMFGKAQMVGNLNRVISHEEHGGGREANARLGGLIVASVLNQGRRGVEAAYGAHCAALLVVGVALEAELRMASATSWPRRPRTCD